MIDPRGPRFGAGITFLVLLVALILGPQHFGWVPLLIQTIAFALGGLGGLAYQPYSWLFRTFVRPRLGAPRELEDERPPRFAQNVGLVFALIAWVGILAHADWVFYLGVGFALAASFLNWAFDFCLGCDFYLLIRKIFGKPLVSRSES